MGKASLPVPADSAAAGQAPGGLRPKRFWQWLVMVPAAAAPLYTAAPVWLDQVRAIYNDISAGSYKEGQEQLQLAYRNMDCLRAPSKYYTNPNRLKIDGTICPSGDVLIRAVDGLQRQAMYILPTSTLQSGLEAATVPSAYAPAPAASSESWPAAPGVGLGLLRAAYDAAGGAGQPSAQLHRAQWGEVRVLWTRQMPGNPRYIIQRVMRPDGCFDQVIDLANGAVVQIMRVQC
jgi:hypothetical protein